MSEHGEEDGNAQIRPLRRTIGGIEAVVAEHEETIRALLARLETLEQPLGAAWTSLHEEYRANTVRLDERRKEADRAWFNVARRRAETEALRKECRRGLVHGRTASCRDRGAEETADEAWSEVERHRIETEELRSEQKGPGPKSNGTTSRPRS